MKIFGFKAGNEGKFINITCNIILGAIVLLVFSLSIFSPVVMVSNSNYEKVYYNGNKENKNISLMVNVYWGDEYLDQMLKIFKDNKIKTTFFVGGSWVAKNNERLLKILGDGHEVGNHGYNHKDHSKLTAEQNRSEINATSELIYSLSGYKMTLFAPPSGSFNKNVLSVASSLNYKTIMWTLDTIDWRDKDENLIFKRATEKADNGSLILMHPTECTVKALQKIISNLKERGFNLTTVSENLAE
ncbi:MAG: polysaccharide deacetylase family protein [Clostridia bacterium]|nr:polysaccharide deacetylase family protein [Clostridia bacterium]